MIWDRLSVARLGRGAEASKIGAKLRLAPRARSEAGRGTIAARPDYFCGRACLAAVQATPDAARLA